MDVIMASSAERNALAFSGYHDLHPERFLPSALFHVIQRELTLAAVLDNVEDRFGSSHLAYLDVLSMGNLPHFAVGLL
jgi:hypothetical protein